MRWHLVTGEYPPQRGGVADYTHLLAASLANAGDEVHVWCPGDLGDSHDAGVSVHRSAGAWTSAGRDRVGRQLRASGDGRVLVQWVPHAFGQRSLNVGFCRWVSSLARRGATIDLMVHEPFLSFRGGSWRQPAAAAVHRAMVATLLRAVRRVWVSIPAWTPAVRPWAFGRRLDFCWLPVPSTLDVTTDSRLLEHARARAQGDMETVVGHFGTYDEPMRRQLAAVVPALLQRVGSRLLLLGRGSDREARRLLDAHPELGDRIVGVGGLPPAELSAHLQACDLLLQPYADGASSRRTTLMAALAHGVPVVTTLGPLSELFWSSSDAVTVVPAADAAAIVDHTVQLIADPERRRRQAAAGRALYESRFSVLRVVDTLRRDRCEPGR